MDVTRHMLRTENTSRMAGEKLKETGVARGSRRVKSVVPSFLRSCCFLLPASKFRLAFFSGFTTIVMVIFIIYPSLQVDLFKPLLFWPTKVSLRKHRLPELNSTILMLSSTDSNEAIEREKVKKLLDRSFDKGYRAYHSNLRRFDTSAYIDHYELLDHMDRKRASIRRLREGMRRDLSNPRFAGYWRRFRSMLESWVRKKHYDPRVLTEMLTTVKYPIDRHYNSVSADLQLGRPYKTCALIGNSGILLNNTYGEFIDSHDMVMRLNNARTSGFVTAVGSKTTLSFVNSNVLHLCSRQTRCICHSYGDYVPMISYICQLSHLMDVVYCSSMHKAPLLVTDPRFDILCSRIVKFYSLKRFVGTNARPLDDWSSTHEGDMFHYSSGFQAVVLALSICEKVDMFGFGKSLFAKHHYHTNQKSELRLHDYEAEYMFYDDLASNLSTSIPFLSETGILIPPVEIFR